MNRQEFIEWLPADKHKFHTQGDWLVVRSKTFDYPGLESVPDYTIFISSMWTDLRCEHLPDNLIFECGVHPLFLTTYKTNFVVNNARYIHCPNPPAITEYKGTKGYLESIDGDLMFITSTRQMKEYKVHKAYYFNGGEISTMRSCYVARLGDYSAHGETIKKAIEDVFFKKAVEDVDQPSIIEGIKKSQLVSKNDYRLLTGACSLGCDRFIEEHGLTYPVPLDTCKELVGDAYGGQKFLELIS
ncbi:MAG: hypothetical protein ACPGXY_03205 [Alphaproteobacteria bacterium]